MVGYLLRTSISAHQNTRHGQWTIYSNINHCVTHLMYSMRFVPCSSSNLFTPLLGSNVDVTRKLCAYMPPLQPPSSAPETNGKFQLLKVNCLFFMHQEQLAYWWCVHGHHQSKVFQPRMYFTNYSFMYIYLANNSFFKNIILAAWEAGKRLQFDDYQFHTSDSAAWWQSQCWEGLCMSFNISVLAAVRWA